MMAADGSMGAGDSSAAKKKMFFTTSDLIEKMNSAMNGFNKNDGMAKDDDQFAPRFELQRKMPDGSYRRAEESELAAADFQVKLKQASTREQC